MVCPRCTALSEILNHFSINTTWITFGISRSVNKKNKLYKYLKLTKSDNF